MSTVNKLGLNERQAVILTVGFYMVTALVMVSVNKVRNCESKHHPVLPVSLAEITHCKLPTLIVQPSCLISGH